MIKLSGKSAYYIVTGWSDNKLYNGFKKPLARHVSNEIISTDNVSPDSTYTHMLMQWGQFLDHDLDHSLPSLSIESFGERVSCRRCVQTFIKPILWDASIMIFLLFSDVERAKMWHHASLCKRRKVIIGYGLGDAWSLHGVPLCVDPASHPSSLIGFNNGNK